ncbi:MAG: hypothetical protein GY795_08880 [Desulfobacterales bacterium]|nr:hypothetical protein [Desulfobacterales bacterium]
MRKIMLITLAVSFIIGNVYAAEWVNISGNVYYESQPLFVMVLANGQHMFTGSAGRYDLTVPLNDNGEITLYSFCEGMAPFKQILQPEQAVNFDIYMSPASSDSRVINLTAMLAPSNDGKVVISGKAATDDGKPLCLMILANGQYMFTSGEDGLYELEVPLNGAGEVTLYGFCEGFAPFRRTLRVMI